MFLGFSYLFPPVFFTQNISKCHQIRSVLKCNSVYDSASGQYLAVTDKSGITLLVSLFFASSQITFYIPGSCCRIKVVDQSYKCLEIAHEHQSRERGGTVETIIIGYSSLKRHRLSVNVCSVNQWWSAQQFEVVQAGGIYEEEKVGGKKAGFTVWLNLNTVLERCRRTKLNSIGDNITQPVL